MPAQLAGQYLSLAEHRRPQRAPIAWYLEAILAHGLGDDSRANDPFGVEHIGEGHLVIAAEDQVLVICLQDAVELLVLGDVKTQSSGVPRLPPRQEGENRIDPNAPLQIVIQLQQLMLIEGRYRHLDAGAELGIVSLQLAQLLIGLNGAIEQARDAADFVVQLGQTIYGDINVQIEVGVLIQHRPDRAEHAGCHASIGGDAHIQGIVVAMEYLDDLGQVGTQKRLAAGGGEEEHVVHALRDALDLVNGQLSGNPSFSLAQEAMLAAGVAVLGHKVDKVEGRCPSFVQNAPGVLYIPQRAHLTPKGLTMESGGHYSVPSAKGEMPLPPQ